MSPHQSTLIAASYNVHKCIGTDRRFDPARIVSVIEEMGADIVALQEVDKRFGKRHGLLDLDHIRARTGLVPAILPQRLSEHAHGWHGNAVLVREGWAATAHGVELPGLEPRGAVIVDIDIDNQPLRIVATHLGLLKSSRKQQLALLASFIAEHPEKPVLVMGDMNEWRMGLRSSLHSLGAHMEIVAAVNPSFPSLRPALSLDRILARPKAMIRALQVHDTPLARKASDHLPLRAEIELPALERVAAE